MTAFGGACPLGLLTDHLKPDALSLVGVMLGVLALTGHRERSPIATAVLVGLSAGICLGTKCAALPSSVVLLVALLVQTRKIRPWLVAVGTTLFVGGGWYLRNFLLHHNPVAPYGSSAFSTFLSVEGNLQFWRATQRFGLGRSVREWVSAPFAMFLFPSRFAGVGNLFSPVAFLFAAWFCSLQNPRLLLPATFTSSVLAAGVVDHWKSTGQRWLSRRRLGTGALGVLPGLTIVFVYSTTYLVLEREQFMKRWSPGYEDVKRIGSTLSNAVDARVFALDSSLSLLRHSRLPQSPYYEERIETGPRGEREPAGAIRLLLDASLAGRWLTPSDSEGGGGMVQQEAAVESNNMKLTMGLGGCIRAFSFVALSDVSTSSMLKSLPSGDHFWSVCRGHVTLRTCVEALNERRCENSRLLRAGSNCTRETNWADFAGFCRESVSGLLADPALPEGRSLIGQRFRGNLVDEG